MELRHVYGRTYAAVGATALMPVYKLTDTDIVLMDTGYAKLDRSALTNLIEDNGFRLRGILCSHAHFDHTGNVRYLQQRYGCQAAAQIIEAGISVNPDAYRANYVALTYGKSHEYFLEECFLADVIIPADADHVDFCGARFGILQLPGHSAGHIGIVTPDNVAYVGDCLIDEGQIEGAKLPTSMFIARDLESKEYLRQLDAPAYIVAHKQVLTNRAAFDALIELIEHAASRHIVDGKPEEVYEPLDHIEPGLPRTLIHVSGSEVLLNDARKAAHMLAASGVPVEVHVWPGQMHVFQLAAPLVKEADRSLKQIGEYIREATW